jgi:indole-3-glycerol phosphate synthase
MFTTIDKNSMNILDRIIEAKKIEVEAAKQLHTIEALQMSAYYNRTCLKLTQRLTAAGATGIITEFKRKSPSKGFINEFADASKVTTDYTNYGASGISVLTDAVFFGGSKSDLLAARHNNIPLLRKDFMIDEYQIVESKAMGADVILLIAACMSATQVQQLAGFAHTLGLEVLLELHEEDELGHVCNEVDMVGINNRNLKTFEVDIDRSLKLAEQIPADKIKVAESGISDVATIQLFKAAGFQGFLIGENFMKTADPGKAFLDFIQ